MGKSAQILFVRTDSIDMMKTKMLVISAAYINMPFELYATMNEPPNLGPTNTEPKKYGSATF